jgi:alkylation response protein AidB-like acyl-CoA dehydrogenase
MRIELTKKQEEAKNRFKAFVDRHVLPYANRRDVEESTGREAIDNLAEAGYLAPTLPEERGGKGMGILTFGLLCEEMGRGSASMLSLLTVQDMVAQGILKWGSSRQRARWLPGMAEGKVLAGFALTEPNVGSDARSVEATATLLDESYVLRGEKKWISWAQIADLFLVVVQCAGKPSAFLLEREAEGVSTEPVQGLLGFRSAMLAHLRMEDCRIPAKDILGRAGFGLSHVGGTALDCGRYSVAWGSVGLAQGCLEECVRYSAEREQGGARLRDYQLVQKMIADMFADIAAARMLCYRAGYLREAGSPQSVMETCVAKYFASSAAYRAATDAVQIHGAVGCSRDSPVQRYFRDAKIMEIIEGTSQIHQLLIADHAYRVTHS